jgi:polar amino acid transport system permease protein
MAWEQIWENRELLLLGFAFTLKLTLITIVSSTVLGFIVAMLRSSRIPVLTQVLTGYIELFRGSPLLVQIMAIYFGAAYLNMMGVSATIAVTIAITLNQGSYMAEIFRAGLESVPAGQREAGRTLGLSRFHIEANVVFPQAMRISIAPLFGQYLALVKNTSLASVIGYTDLVRQGQGLIDRIGFPFEVYFVIAVLYFVVGYPLSLTARHLERRVVKA